MSISIRIEGTDLTVSRLAFGTASMHHLRQETRQFDLLSAVANIGVTHFDTAPLYGFGICERILGQVLRGQRKRFSVASKFGLYPPGGTEQSVSQVWIRKIAGKVYPPLSRHVVDWSIKMAEASLTGSLARLETDYLDILFLYEPDPGLIQTDEMLAFLENEKRRGRVRYWGLSGPMRDLSNLIDHPLAMVIQAKDSLIDRDADIVTAAGRPLQFTFGYISSAARNRSTNGIDILKQALARNQTGAVLFSSRKIERIQAAAVLLAPSICGK
jgi:aryl-alcohol dehydrogenase-like predicted oxidoreductase